MEAETKGEALLDLVLKGRGIRITDPMRRTAEHKLAKIARIEPRVTGIEVEVVSLNPREGASHRIEVACRRGRRTFRAAGAGQTVDTALDQAVQRLERQLTSYRGRLRNRLMRRGDRLQSRRTSPEEGG